MEGWKIFEGKKVFISLKNGRQYSGIVNLIDTSALPLIFIFIIDKFGNAVTITSSEIEVIQEESK